MVEEQLEVKTISAPAVHDSERMKLQAEYSTQPVVMKHDGEPMFTVIKIDGEPQKLDVKIAPASFKQKETRLIMVNDYDEQKGENVVNFARLSRNADYSVSCEPVGEEEKKLLTGQIKLALDGNGEMPEVYPLGVIEGENPGDDPKGAFVMNEKIIPSDVEGVVK